MSCPAEVSRILLAILTMGLLRIRSLSWSGQGDRCALEADHIHNLPSLLADYSEGALLYYWETERPSYVSQTAPDDVAQWEPLWRELRPHAESLSASAAAH